MAIYLPPSLREFLPRVRAISAWIDHMPFGYDLVAAVRPSLLVELGAYKGLSYFTMCQSVLEHGIEALCYAVDTWEGDVHTKTYGEEVYKGVVRANREHFSAFSYLIRMRFEDAVVNFDDGAIDLLHIDGCHTYEAVKRDFTLWYPKVRPGGIVLLHDTAARHDDFGVYKFWDELSGSHAETFHFHHGYGLGVVRKPGGNPARTPLTDMLFSGDPETERDLRAFYVHAARFIICRMQETSLGKHPPAKQNPKPE